MSDMHNGVNQFANATVIAPAAAIITMGVDHLRTKKDQVFDSLPMFKRINDNDRPADSIPEIEVGPNE